MTKRQRLSNDVRRLLGPASARQSFERSLLLTLKDAVTCACIYSVTTTNRHYKNVLDCMIARYRPQKRNAKVK
jgi:hypothetical protein